MRPVPVDDGRYNSVELIVLFGFFLVWVAAILWVTFWQYVWCLIVWIARKQVAHAEAKAFLASQHRFERFDAA